MFWPDGKPRGILRDAPPLPPFRPMPPGWQPPDQESPLARELGTIFKGHTETMIERHVAAQRRIHEQGPE